MRKFELVTKMRDQVENRNTEELSGNILDLLEASDHELIVISICLVVSLSPILCSHSDLINYYSANIHVCL